MHEAKEGAGWMRVVAAAAIVAASASCWAQRSGYPERPVRVIVPFPAGGAIDNIARYTTQDLSKALDAQLLVDNRSGAGGALGTELAARAAPDGYTLLVSSTSPMAINPHINKVSYDPLASFSAVGMIASSPQMLVVPPSLPVRSVKEFIALAKSKPGALTFASSGVGTIIHVTAELFAQQAGIKLLHVPYKGAAPAVVDTVSGQTTMLFAAYSSVAAQVRAGRLRALALTSAKRMAIAPDLPTVAESGLPGFSSTQWWAISGPAGMSAQTVTRLNSELNRVLRSDDMKKRLAAEGAEAAPGTPAELNAYVKADYEKWGEVIRRVGIKAE
jgi:tripartite-type tricarboxylate transporter receptor subunit TctC